MQIAENFGNVDESGASGSDSESPYADPEDSEVVAEAKKEPQEPVEFSFTERDVILYNLGIGATEQELQWTYENHEDFAALPTFGVIPQFLASAGLSFDFLPNFNPVSVACASVVLCTWMPTTSLRILAGEASPWRAVLVHQGAHPDQRRARQRGQVSWRSRLEE